MKRSDNNIVYRIWRVSNILYKLKIPFIPFFFQQLLRFVFGCIIPYRTKIGRNVFFRHMGMGIIIHPDSCIGNNVVIYQHVTIGGKGEGLPVIGDNVFIGAGAQILGNIKIGNNVKIGSNAVVIQNVPDNSTAVGVPARIIKKEK